MLGSSLFVQSGFRLIYCSLQVTSHHITSSCTGERASLLKRLPYDPSCAKNHDLTQLSVKEHSGMPSISHPSATNQCV